MTTPTPQIAFKTRETVNINGQTRVVTSWAIRYPFYSSCGIDPLEPFPVDLVQNCPVIDLSACAETVVESILRRYIEPAGVNDIEGLIAALEEKGAIHAS